ncbi:MAG: cytochrome c family protein [Novosphingobium sp.]
MRLATALVAPALFALSACGGGGSQSQDQGGASPTPEVSPSESGISLASSPPEFAQCASCHTVRKGLNAVGPSLFGVFGRKAGTADGYAYSEANKNSGLTWDEATLDTYLTSPMKMVPGTKMTFAGLADPAKRKAVIAFLKTVK